MCQNLSRPYASPLLLRISCSNIYRYIVLAIFGLSALSIYIINDQLNVVSIILFVFLILATIKALNSNQALNLHWQQNDDWLISSGHQFVSAKLCDSSVITSFCSILNFNREDGCSQSILIFKDNIDADSFRRLRVRVKVQGINSQAHDIIAP